MFAFVVVVGLFSVIVLVCRITKSLLLELMDMEAVAGNVWGHTK
jgi:hypothetical protein